MFLGKQISYIHYLSTSVLKNVKILNNNKYTNGLLNALKNDAIPLMQSTGLYVYILYMSLSAR